MKKIFLLILIIGFMFLFSCSANVDKIENDENPTETTFINTTENIVQKPEKLQDLNVVYDLDSDLKMDIYYPTTIKYKKSPLIVAFHGGGWIAGDKSQIMYIFAPLIKELRENGYTIVTVQYKYASEINPFPEQIRNCINSFDYLKDNAEKYNIDIDSVGVMGYSAGAHLAMFSSYAWDNYMNILYAGKFDEPFDIKYCLSFAGPTKFYDDDDVNKYSRDILYLVENLFQCTYENNPGIYEKGSPYYYLTVDNVKKVPLFLAQDEKDDVVPFSQSQIMYDKAVEVEIECELMKLNGVYHQIDFNSDYMYSPSSDETVKIILKFIYKYSGK
jgi:acetyl esterase/lipase